MLCENCGFVLWERFINKCIVGAHQHIHSICLQRLHSQAFLKSLNTSALVMRGLACLQPHTNQQHYRVRFMWMGLQLLGGERDAQLERRVEEREEVSLL